MPRYIDADAVNRVFVDELGKIPSVFIAERIEWDAAREAIIRCAKEVSIIPTTDVVEQKRGKWIRHSIGHENTPWGFDCSACGKWFVIGEDTAEQYHFCPNCGAEMEE